MGWSVFSFAPPLCAALSASYTVSVISPPGSELSVYHASVLHSGSPEAELNGRGERRCTTRPGFRPATFSVTLRPDAFAEVTVSGSSSTFGPPYVTAGT